MTDPNPATGASSDGKEFWELLQSLPYTVLDLIFTSMNRCDLGNLRRSCSTARYLVNYSVRSIRLRKLAGNPADSAVQARAYSSFPNVRRLLLSCEGVKTDGMVQFLLNNKAMMKQLQHIEADVSAVLFESTWDFVLEACDLSKLKTWLPCPANRRQPAFVKQVRMLASQPSCGLVELNLSLSPLKDAELQHICQGCRKLQVLVLDNCTQLTDTGLAYCGQLLGLQSLSIDKCMLTCEGFVSLSHLTTLTNLVVGYNNTTAEGCAAIASLPAVRHLSISKHPHSFPGLGVLITGPPPIVASLTRLSIHCTKISADHIAILKKLKELRTSLYIAVTNDLKCYCDSLGNPKCRCSTIWSSG